jgi:hypothetical protein
LSSFATVKDIHTVMAFRMFIIHFLRTLEEGDILAVEGLFTRALSSFAISLFWPSESAYDFLSRRLEEGDISAAEGLFTRALSSFGAVKDTANAVLVHCNMGHARRGQAEAMAADAVKQDRTVAGKGGHNSLGLSRSLSDLTRFDQPTGVSCAVREKSRKAKTWVVFGKGKVHLQ